MGWLQNLVNWFNTDGTPMLGNSGIDVEGKGFGEVRHETHFENHHNDFSIGFGGCDSFGGGSGGGFGSDF